MTRRLNATVFTFPSHGSKEIVDNVIRALCRLFDPALFTFSREGCEGEGQWIHVSSKIHLTVHLVDKMTMAVKGYLLGCSHEDLI